MKYKHIMDGVLILKDGSNKGIIYWKLNYRKKFMRTLWMIPFSVFVLIMLFTFSESPVHLKIIATSILLVTLLIQLIYTHYKWKNET